VTALDSPPPDDSPASTSLVSAVLAIQLATGTLLATYYCPAPDAARASVAFIDTAVSSGRLVRSLHVWGTSLLVLFLGTGIAFRFVTGRFTGSHRPAWIAGSLGLFLVLAQAFTGSVLPWDGRAQAAATIAGELAASSPVAGDAARRLALGGPRPGGATLTRFYALHATLLPIAILAVWVAATAGRRPGRTAPAVAPDWRRVAGALGATLALLLFATGQPPPVIPASATGAVEATGRPEWYFLPMYELLHHVPASGTFLAGLVMPLLGALVLVAWPWVERIPARSTGRRGVLVLSASFAAAWGCLLGLALSRPAIDPRSTAPSPVSGSAPAGMPSPSTPTGSPSRGRALFTELRCAACHDGKAGPTLAHEGSMVHRAWLEGFVRRPHRIRWRAENVRPVLRMPNFELAAEEARDLAAHLALARDDRRFPDRDAAPLPAEQVEAGRTAFREYQCLGCHRLEGEGAHVGPDLTGAGRRLRRGWVEVFLKDPEALIRGSPMKDLKLWPEEAEALAAYLATL
jgi:quinol-cytochrome oxidoreductase complex cytochrome b subunit